MQNELTAERIEEAIEEIAESGVYGNQVHQETMETALAALRAEQERSKGCEYCTSRFDIASHHTNAAGLQAGTNKKATHCPMCGRKLERSDT